jgi:hypothetical protein
MTEEKDYTVSSDNIFADHGRLNPEERLMRTELSFYIATEIKRRGLSQCSAWHNPLHGSRTDPSSGSSR